MPEKLNRICWLLRYCLIVGVSLIACRELAAQNTKSDSFAARVKGSSTALITVEAFNDYQCPSSKSFDAELKKIEIEYKDNVRIVFRNYPLIGTHKFALESAEAAEAAGMQGKFFEMVEILYRHQEQWGTANDITDIFAGYARELGLDVEKFLRDMRSKQTRKRITLDLERGKSLKVEGTPTVLVNGRDIGPPTIQRLRAAIEESLRASSPEHRPTL